jgi:hypothetical protein
LSWQNAQTFFFGLRIGGFGIVVLSLEPRRGGDARFFVILACTS